MSGYVAKRQHSPQQRRWHALVAALVELSEYVLPHVARELRERGRGAVRQRRPPGAGRPQQHIEESHERQRFRVVLRPCLPLRVELVYKLELGLE